MGSRPMPNSTVVPTDEEIKTAMKADNASKTEIDAAIDERKANTGKVEADYAKTSAKFDASLQQQNRK